ncbi:MAG TPA: hypothetical protein DD716_04240 [Thiomicrospira sp.]|jgi:general secretion pathway protein I|nr:hypothetical protein [Thiomicrospira sp.]
MSSSIAKNKGFSLIEVMVALIIASISLIALSQTLGQYVYNQGGLQKRVVATWVAQNRFIEIQNKAQNKADLGGGGSLNKEQTENMLGADWQTKLTTQPTLIPGLMRANLQVSLKGDKAVVAEVVSIVGK